MSHLHSEGAQHCWHKLVDLSQRKLKVDFISKYARILLFERPTYIFAGTRASSYTETDVSSVHRFDPFLVFQPPLRPKPIRILTENFLVLLDYMRVHWRYRLAELGHIRTGE